MESSIAVSPSKLPLPHYLAAGWEPWLSCGSLPEKRLGRFTAIRSANLPIAQFPPARLKRYHGKAAFRLERSAVRNHYQVGPVPPPKIRCGPPAIILFMMPITMTLVPEVSQNVQQKNNAHAIQHKKDSHGLEPPDLRRQGSTLVKLALIPPRAGVSLNTPNSGSPVFMPLEIVQCNLALCAFSYRKVRQGICSTPSLQVNLASSRIRKS